MSKEEKGEIVYQGKMIEVIQQKVSFGEVEKTFEFARRAPGVRMLVISPEKKVLITKEYRREVDGWDYRLPGGKVFDSLVEYNEFLESGKDILRAAESAAIKEAKEEAGMEVINLKHMATSHCGATVEWNLYYFLVTKFEDLGEQDLELGEDIELTWQSFDEVKKLCLSGAIQEDRTVAVLLRYLMAS